MTHVACMTSSMTVPLNLLAAMLVIPPTVLMQHTFVQWCKANFQLAFCSNMLGLQYLRLQNTTMTGVIPAQLGDLPFLIEADLRDTLMSCCNNQEEADKRDENGTLLPPFLKFHTTYTLTHQPHVL